MNKCGFSGRLVRDPELQTFSSGKKKVRFTLVVDRRYQNSDGKWESDPSFLDFEAWDRGAETIAERFKKGSFMLIDDASVKTDRWEDKNTGEKRQKLCFRCNHFELLPLLNTATENGEEEQQPQPPPAKAPTPAKSKGKKAKEPPPEADEVGEDDIPF